MECGRFVTSCRGHDFKHLPHSEPGPSLSLSPCGTATLTYSGLRGHTVSPLMRAHVIAGGWSATLALGLIGWPVTQEALQTRGAVRSSREFVKLPTVTLTYNFHALRF